MVDIPTTQRAYTLRLRGESKDDQSWRRALWQTHLAVNRGAKAFGDWLLILRGGLCHTLAEQKVPAGKNKPERDPTDAERSHRRKILALSWLSVESHDRDGDTPTRFLVPVDAGGKPQTVESLRGILLGRGIEASEVADWIRDCGDSLKSTIKENAVWVNRSRAFDEKVEQIGPSLTRSEIWDLLERFFSDAKGYFGTDILAATSAREEADENENEETGIAPKAELTEKSKDRELAKEANGWLRDRFGTGKGADFTAKATEYSGFASWCRRGVTGRSPSELLAELQASLAVAVLPRRLAATSGESNAVQIAYERVVEELESGKQPSRTDWDKLASLAEDRATEKRLKVGKKGRRGWTQELLCDVERSCGIQYIDPGNGTQRGWEYCVMLDHAARRISQSHSWIKLAEGERRAFEVDARKVDSVPHAIVEWLDKFCRDRSKQTGTTDDDGYRIRKRAIPDWSLVVAKWAKPDCRTVEDRIEAAREVQADPENDKPGDNQLYEALATDDAKLVWLVKGSATAQPLKDYVAAREAEHNKRRFKVPAYRHPDELRHPVFCDFGNSRWSIDFAAHRFHSKIESVQETVERRQLDLNKADQGLAKAATEEKVDAAKQKLTLARQQLDDAQKQLAWLQSHRGLRMKLWNGIALAEQPLIWQSKRLQNELTAPRPTTDEDASFVQITRINRLALAAAEAKPDSQLKVLGLLELKDWNGRLQVPRAELDRIADIRDGTKRKQLSKAERDDCVTKMIAQLNWLVTYSARLQPQGPWMDYAKTQPDLVKPDPKYWPHAIENKQRKGRARRILSHLPGLRVLSVDLGHRYAAACTVWEAITGQAFQNAIDQAKQEGAEVCFGVPDAKQNEAVYCHVKFPKRVATKATKKAVAEGRGTFQPVTVYRRIGCDILPDGSLHPAPWARLDRQFLIKLQGEDEQPRAVTDEERGFVESMENEIGYLRRDAEQNRRRRIDEAMFDVVRVVRLALYRHGDYARLAAGLVATEKPEMGNRLPVTLNGSSLEEYLLDLLERWHELAHSPRWVDAFARSMWQQHIAPRLGDTSLLELSDEMTGPERKATKSKLRAQLAPVAKKLATENRTKIAAEWQQEWSHRDKKWHQHLRFINRWIMPRGTNANGVARKGDRKIRHVGGLSLNRIATFKSLYQVHKAFFTRQKPDGKKPGSAGKGFGQRTLMAMERMRQNRVKQLASRIAEGALGIGIEDQRNHHGHERSRPRERLNGHRFAACHAVVIENLTNYRPDELQTRRENRQLMTWAASQVKKHLTDQCQLHGLHLREVPPGYTSRQDSRTGAPGVRCSEIRVEDLSRRYARQLSSISQKGATDPFARYLLAMKQKYLNHENKPKTESIKDVMLRIPKKGGELFVSACTESSSGNSLQADLNAAANIGLRALLDPDWPGAWWYIPAIGTAEGDFTPKLETCAGSRAVSGKQFRLKTTDRPPANPAAESSLKPQAKKAKTANRSRGCETVNLWCDISNSDLNDRNWQLIYDYSNTTMERVTRQLTNRDEQLHGKLTTFVNEEIPF